jgi:probable selenium-dependent hydroxylase accessory protein YqeC
MFCSFDQFVIPGGIISVIGSGGKTSFLRYLSETLPGTVLLAASTHIYPFRGIPLLETNEETDLETVRALLRENRLLCLGTPAENGKLTAPAGSFSALSRIADRVLVEADGSRCRPLKAHRSFEPVIPEGSALTVCIAGLSGLGQPVFDACHCPELFARLTGTNTDALVTPEMIARVLNAEDLADVYFINQTDLSGGKDAARKIADLIHKPVFAGSLKEKKFLYGRL